MDPSDQRSSLTILRTLALYARNPKQALFNEQREWGKWQAYRELKRRGLVAMYGYRPAWVYPPEWADLWNIYSVVRRRKPQVILEFGSGCSTMMFAAALAENGSGRLYSVETNKRFMGYTESYIPTHLKPFVEMSLSEIDIGDMNGNRVMWHRNIPDVRPNLVYLDGPDYQEFSPDVNVQAEGVMLEGPDDYAVLIDYRPATFKFTRDNLKHQYKVSVDPVHNWELLERLST